MPPVGFEPTISAGERPQTHTLDRAATGNTEFIPWKYSFLSWSRNSPNFMESKVTLAHSQVPATLPYAEPDQSNSTSSQTISFRYILIFTHLSLGFSSGLFPSGLYNKTPYAPLLSSIRATWPAHLILVNLLTLNNIFRGIQILKLLIVKFSPVPCYFVPLRPKYFRRASTVCAFLLKWETKFQTHVKQHEEL